VSLRRRATLAAAAAVTVAVLMASVATYLVMAAELRGQIDDSLRERADRLPLARPLEAPGPALPRFREELPPPPPTARLGGAEGYVQVVDADGAIVRSGGGGAALPVTGRTRDLARSGGGTYFSEARVGSSHLRILTTALPGGLALQIARPLNEVDKVLARMRMILAAILLAGVAVAVTLGRLVTRAALAPVERLTEASEHVAATQDLSRRIDVEKEDEIGRLAGSFNTMLDALERSMKALDASVRAQRRLVADASHELRTPLTSLRTNIDVLRQPEELSRADRERLVEEISSQLDELTVLMADLIELARGDEPLRETEDVRIDLLVDEAIDRAQRHSPQLRVERRLEPTVVEGVPERLERAVSNLLDNAAKWSPEGEAVEVELSGGELTVADRGPGIAADDLPHVFDRFYRAPAARSVPGSGLGLAIVRQVAEAHGGEASVESTVGHGTRFRLRLPATGLASSGNGGSPLSRRTDPAASSSDA
jgi:two-component system sensor histidine kinase MprB